MLEAILLVEKTMVWLAIWNLNSKAWRCKLANLWINNLNLRVSVPANPSRAKTNILIKTIISSLETMGKIYQIQFQSQVKKSLTNPSENYKIHTDHQIMITLIICNWKMTCWRLSWGTWKTSIMLQSKN